MTSANKDPENLPINQPEESENIKQEEADIALDPNPSKALTELVTGSETDTPTDESA